MSSTSSWYAYVNGQVQGPFTQEQLAAMARSGALTPETPLCGDGATYVPASQALPQLFAVARGPAAPPMPPPMAPPMAPPMMPRPAGGRGGKVALFVGLGAAVAAAVVVVILLLPSSGGGGGALLTSLAAELPAGERFEFVDIDAMETLDEDAARDLDDATGLQRVPDEKLAEFFPKGRRGAAASVRMENGRVRVYCPTSWDESALAKLLENNGYEKKSEGGVELWVPGAGSDEGIALKKGRIYSGPPAIVKDMVLGKLAREKTFVGMEGCRELLARLSSSPANVEMRKESPRASSTKARPLWSARETSVGGSRIEARILGLFANSEDVEKAIKELEADKAKMEEAMKQGRRLPFKNVEFESLSSERHGTLVIVTTTFKRTAGKP